MLFQCGQSPTRAASLKRRPFPNTWPDRIRIPGEQPDGGGGGEGRACTPLPPVQHWFPEQSPNIPPSSPDDTPSSSLTTTPRPPVSDFLARTGSVWTPQTTTSLAQVTEGQTWTDRCLSMVPGPKALKMLDTMTRLLPTGGGEPAAAPR